MRHLAASLAMRITRYAAKRATQIRSPAGRRSGRGKSAPDD
jgi:hypothetical protein